MSMVRISLPLPASHQILQLLLGLGVISVVIGLTFGWYQMATRSPRQTSSRPGWQSTVIGGEANFVRQLPYYRLRYHDLLMEIGWQPPSKCWLDQSPTLSLRPGCYNDSLKNLDRLPIEDLFLPWENGRHRHEHQRLLGEGWRPPSGCNNQQPDLATCFNEGVTLHLKSQTVRLTEDGYFWIHAAAWAGRPLQRGAPITLQELRSLRTPVAGGDTAQLRFVPYRVLSHRDLLLELGWQAPHATCLQDYTTCYRDWPASSTVATPSLPDHFPRTDDYQLLLLSGWAPPDCDTPAACLDQQLPSRLRPYVLYQPLWDYGDHPTSSQHIWVDANYWRLQAPTN